MNLSVTVSSDSSVSVTPKIHCKNSNSLNSEKIHCKYSNNNLNSDNEIVQSKSKKKKSKHRRTNSDPGPNRPRYDSV